MIEKIQANFDRWLSQQSENKDGLNSSVLIIAVIGKEVAGNTKADLLNNFLGKFAFFDDVKNRNNLINYLNCDEAKDVQIESSSPLIDVYFDKEESIIWLMINGFNDVELQNLLFNNVVDSFKNKSFFEKMAFIGREQLFALAQIFPLCNALIFLEQGCRFDLEWICLLKRLNKLRLSISRRIRSTFSSLSLSETELSSLYPSSFVNNCRIGVPRLLFCFYRNPFRSDLGISKKKELLEKMEKCLETQIAHLLKQHRLVDIKYPNNAFSQITISSGTPFVYCFNQSEMPVDTNHELAEALFGSLGETGGEDDVNSVKSGGGVISTDEIQNLIAKITEPSKPDKESLENPSDYNFHFFLHKAINKLRKDLTSSKEQKSSSLELPTLGQFIETAKILRRCVYEEKMGRDRSDLKIITPEIDSIDSLLEFSINSARAFYTRQLSLQPKITGEGDAVFSKSEHEYTLKKAIDNLRVSYPHSAGLNNLDNIISHLAVDCENIWKDGHQRCETSSLTCQLCAYILNHESIGNNAKAKINVEGNARRKTQKNQHCSGVKTFSLCNCGMSRRIRTDPFTLKDANFTFYNETSDDNFNFGYCCEKLDKYQFKLFEPSTASSYLHEKDFDKDEEYVEDFVKHEADLMSLQGNEKKTSTTPKQNPQPELVTTLPNEWEDNLPEIDPSDFNVRFFDDGDEESGEEINEKMNNIKLQQTPLEMTSQEESVHNQQILLLGEDDEYDDDEQIRKKNVLASDEEFSEEEYDDDDEEEEEEEEEEVNVERQASSPSQNIPPPSYVVDEDTDNSSSPEPPEMHYLDEYDSHLTRKDDQNINIENRKTAKNKLKFDKLDDSIDEEKFKGQFLDHVPHSNSPPSLLPLFPSFSVVCIGHSSLYNHSTGIRGHDRNARFRNGSEFLLPWSVRLSVNTERWVRELQLIGVNPTEQTLRNLQNGIAHGRIESKEKVKLFVGFDYECPRGHRFTCSEPAKLLKHRKAAGPLNQDADQLLDSDLPLWMLCPCRKEPRTTAQLMRIHVVTPKAPVAVTLQPRIQMSDDNCDDFFFPGAMERIELGWAKYYVCRLPYVYIGPNGRCQSLDKQNSPQFKGGQFLRQSITVRYLPISST